MPSLDEVEPRIGDVIAATRTFEVVDVFDAPNVYKVQDVDSGERFTLTQTGSLSVAITKRAKRGYKEGDVLTGPEVAAWDAPVGTVVAHKNCPDIVHFRTEEYVEDFEDDGEEVFSYDWKCNQDAGHISKATDAHYRIVYLP